MKNLLFTFLLFLFYFYSKAQINLIPNPSFESVLSCPTNSQVKQALYWDTLMAGGGGSPDYYNVCSLSPSDFGVPTNNSSTCCLGFQYANTGNAYMGITTAKNNPSFPDFREYIQCQLNQKLVAGNSYCVKLYANLLNGAYYYCDSLGLFFDDGSIHANYRKVANVSPQVRNVSLTLNDTLNWMKIEGSFTANGTEEYLTIGNFKNDMNSTPVLIGTGNPFGKEAYYYIDDVSVIDIITPAYAGNDSSITLGDSIFLGRQPEVGLNEDCIWFVNGSPIDTIAGMWVTPDTSTSYVLLQTICGTVNYDTVEVTVVDPLMIKKTNTVNSIRIYPIPSNGKFVLQNNQSQLYRISITNLLGEVVYATQSNLNIVEIDLSNQSKGIYFIAFSGKDFMQSEKIIIE